MLEITLDAVPIHEAGDQESDQVAKLLVAVDEIQDRYGPHGGDWPDPSSFVLQERCLTGILGGSANGFYC